MYVAVDIGGTKTLLVVFSAAGVQEELIKFKTPVLYTDFLAELATNVAKLSTEKFAAAAIAVPARLNRETGVAIAFGNLGWENIPIGSDMDKIFDCPVRIENDAKLAALSEASLVKEFRKVLYLTISTGIGGGLVIDGRLDPNFVDMEVGQILLEHEGKLTDWEDFGSGKAFMNKFGKKVSEMADTETAAWYWLARNIAVGLIDLIATLTPDLVIIGGGAGAHLEKFQDRLEEELKIYENPMFSIPPIRKARRAEEAVVYGCFEILKERA